MTAMSDALENSLIDFLFRGQSYSAPTALWVALFTSAPNDAGGGVEVSTSGTGYARVNLSPSLANWAGTQGQGTTSASSGQNGTTSNNAAITFPAPTGNWGSISHFGIFSAQTGGTLYWHGALTVAKTVNNGDAAPSFQPAALSIQIDN